MVRKLIIVMCLSLAILTSCETDKKNLEKAKAEISELTAKNQQLSDVKGHLETDESALTQEIAQLKDQNVALGRNGIAQNNASQLVQKNEAIQKKSEQTDAEVTKLKKQKDELMAKMVRAKEKKQPLTLSM